MSYASYRRLASHQIFEIKLKVIQTAVVPTLPKRSEKFKTKT